MTEGIENGLPTNQLLRHGKKQTTIPRFGRLMLIAKCRAKKQVADALQNS